MYSLKENLSKWLHCLNSDRIRGILQKLNFWTKSAPRVQKPPRQNILDKKPIFSALSRQERAVPILAKFNSLLNWKSPVPLFQNPFKHQVGQSDSDVIISIKMPELSLEMPAMEALDHLALQSHHMRIKFMNLSRACLKEGIQILGPLCKLEFYGDREKIFKLLKLHGFDEFIRPDHFIRQEESLPIPVSPCVSPLYQHQDSSSSSFSSLSMIFPHLREEELSVFSF